MPDKAKRQPQSDKPREFYVRLSMMLMIPPLLLFGLMSIPIVIVNNFPERLLDACERFATEKQGLRIESYVRYDNPAVILSTQDGGETWQEIVRLPRDEVPPETRCDTMQFFSDDDYAVWYDTAIAVTHDSGASWHVTHVDMPANCTLTQVNFSTAQNGTKTVTCAGVAKTTYTTTDGGINWE